MFSPGKWKNNAKAKTRGGLTMLRICGKLSLLVVFQLCTLHMHFHIRTSQPMSRTCIQCTSVSLNVRKAISHCISEGNILYLVLIWPIAISIK